MSRRTPLNSPAHGQVEHPLTTWDRPGTVVVNRKQRIKTSGGLIEFATEADDLPLADRNHSFDERFNAPSVGVRNARQGSRQRLAHTRVIAVAAIVVLGRRRRSEIQMSISASAHPPSSVRSGRLRRTTLMRAGRHWMLLRQHARSQEVIDVRSHAESSEEHGCNGSAEQPLEHQAGSPLP